MRNCTKYRCFHVLSETISVAIAESRGGRWSARTQSEPRLVPLFDPSIAKRLSILKIKQPA
jgi:hypothetical protein